MYGMVNRGIRDLVLHIADEEAWLTICAAAGISNTTFSNTTVYDDAITYDLVAAASETLGMEPSAVLEQFGRHWILFTGQQGWGPLFDIAGRDLRSFVHGLEAMHSRVQASMPDCRMPSFAVEDDGDGGLVIDYRSEREGLASMVLGLFRGLVEHFDEGWEIEQAGNRKDDGYDRFVLRPLTVGAKESGERVGTA